MQNAIVCLTRGYADLTGYGWLLRRNWSIYDTINRGRKAQYPLIIWHEGNISAEHQRYILGRECNADVRFINISPVFLLPENLEASDLLETWSVGYRLMCRFHTYHVWQYVTQFDYVLRLDEDCTLRTVAFDPLESLARVGGDFATATFVSETHALTNQTLGPFTRKYAANMPPPLCKGNPYNQRFPYTNLYVTRTAFWWRPEVQQFLYTVVRQRDSLRCRWGDLPVLGVTLNMFGRSGNIYRIPHLTYEHGSHYTTIASA